MIAEGFKVYSKQDLLVTKCDIYIHIYTLYVLSCILYVVYCMLCYISFSHYPIFPIIESWNVSSTKWCHYYTLLHTHTYPERKRKRTLECNLLHKGSYAGRLFSSVVMRGLYCLTACPSRNIRVTKGTALRRSDVLVAWDLAINE